MYDEFSATIIDPVASGKWKLAIKDYNKIKIITKLSCQKKNNFSLNA